MHICQKPPQFQMKTKDRIKRQFSTPAAYIQNDGGVSANPQPVKLSEEINANSKRINKSTLNSGITPLFPTSLFNTGKVYSANQTTKHPTKNTEKNENQTGRMQLGAWGSNGVVQGFFNNPFSKLKKSTKSTAGSLPIPYPNIGGENSMLGSFTQKAASTFGGAFASAKNTLNESAENFKTNSEGVANALTGSGADYMGAIKFALNMFKIQASFRDITIHAVTAIGSPGCLNGPDLESSIRNAPSTVGMQGDDQKVRNAVAKGVSNNFNKWKSKLIVPGLPWYPAFASYPGAKAPPMPNVPTPLISCVSSAMPSITTPTQIKSSIMSQLSSDLKTPKTEAFISSLSAQIAAFFFSWISTQMVMNVLGHGSVPSFAPPVVPAGPVIGGSIISMPGHLLS
jgi:hypothetical protein